MHDHSRLTPLERFLGLFTDIRPGEGVTGVVLFANVFLILCAYYFIKPLRESWIALSPIEGLSSMEVKAYSSFAQSLLLAWVASVFARRAASMPRRDLLTRSSLICMSNLVAFWLLQPGLFFDDIPYLGIVYYLWVGMFGVFIVAQFWTMAADLYSGERGTRLLPLIAIGATGGAAFGSYLTSKLVGSGYFDPSSLLLVANVPLGVAILLTRKADARGPLGDGQVAGEEGPPRPQASPGDEPSKATASAAGSSDGGGAVAFILRHRYLFSVALVVMLANWVNTNGENLLFRVIQDGLAVRAEAEGITEAGPVAAFVRLETTVFYSSFFFWVNIVALVAQAFFASRLLRYGGFGAIMLLLPSIALVSYSTMAFWPVLAVVRVLKIAENSTDYSINNTARQVLWLPTSAEMKYRAKPAVDSLFVRLGDGLAALTVLIGVQFLDLSTSVLFLINVVLVLAWLATSVGIVRSYSRMMAQRTEPAAA